MAKTYRPYVPEQDLLLPPSLRDWLPEDHLAFFVSDLIDQLDLAAITTVYEDEDRGYPPYHPVMLTKVLVYAYCVGVFSSRKIQRRLIEDVLSGRSWLPEMIEKRAKPKRGQKTFRIAPRADIRNSLSNRFSVIEVEGLDRPGLLSEITGALSDLSLDIASAHITTFGEKVIDTFYVTDLTGAKIENPTRLETIRERLIAVLEGAAPERVAKSRAAAE